LSGRPPGRGLLRARGGHDRARVTYVELFFDLVFVFAVTQLSHLLIAHLDAAGAIHATVLLAAVWWAWIDTSWVTNWLDPQRPSVRLLLFALMFVGLMLSASIPGAFQAQALLFALAYATIQIGRSAFMLVALRRDDRRNFRNFQRIFAWHLLIGLLWIAGALVEGSARLAMWIVAVGLESAAPLAGFAVPGLGRSTTADWNVDGGHLAERCALFVIIALGESILVTGATAAGEPATATTVTAFVMAFVGSVAMWWIYFNIGEERATRKIAADADPGRLARAAYTYVHLLIVAGIVVEAVADELTLVHVDGALDLPQAAVILGAPALYLAGNLLFKRASARFVPLSHLVGLGLLAASALVASRVTAPVLGSITTGILVMVAIWETVSLRPRVASQQL
jgi:low temperature requirement protein LtrA